jgi:hypothetical protein
VEPCPIHQRPQRLPLPCRRRERAEIWTPTCLAALGALCTAVSRQQGEQEQEQEQEPAVVAQEGQGKGKVIGQGERRMVAARGSVGP